MKWISAPDRMRHVSRVVAVFLDVLPNQLLEEYPTRRDPAMVSIGGETVAVAECAVMQDDPADAAAGPRCARDPPEAR